LIGLALPQKGLVIDKWWISLSKEMSIFGV